MKTKTFIKALMSKGISRNNAISATKQIATLKQCGYCPNDGINKNTVQKLIAEHENEPLTPLWVFVN